MREIRNIFGGVLILGSLALSAQNELPSGQIEVVKDFEVRLTETRKIRIIPQPVQVDTSVRTFQYALLAPSPAIEYLIPEIKPLAITAEKKPEAYTLFAKAGYGSPNSLLGALSYDRVQSQSFLWGVDFHHLSANHKKVELQKFSDSRGRINGSYLWNETIRLDGYIDGRFEKVYFYGADPIPSNPEALKRTFNRYDAHFNLSSIYDPSTSLRYAALFRYRFDKDNLGSRETQLGIGGEMGSALNNGEIPLGLRVMADLSKLRHTEEHSVHNILIEPYADYILGDLHIHLAGLALLRKEENELLPRIELTYHLVKQLLTLKAGWRGEVEKNNFHSLSSYNPFISARLDSLNNRIERRIYAGASGSAGRFSYEVNGGYTRFSGMALFLQDEDTEEQFVPVYDNGSFVTIDGAIRYEILKYVTLHARVIQRFFKFDHENKPWHLPALGIDGQLMYTGGGDTYHVSVLLHVENGLPYRTVGGTEDRLDPLIELNLHGDYYITESIGAFAEINNLFGNKRERWFTYPSIGFNAKAGVLFRLP